MPNHMLLVQKKKTTVFRFTVDRKPPHKILPDSRKLIIDWESNVDPDFAEHHFMRPRPVRRVEEMEAEGYVENWICYRSGAFSAKELTVLPARSVTITDAAAYGLIMMQGHGTMGKWEVETPAMIRFGLLTHDE